MPKPKTIKTKTGNQHFSVGAIIKSKDKMLLIERNLPPSGFACVAGHIDEKEVPFQALKREIAEESNLDLLKQKLLFKKTIFQKENCPFNEKRHKWYVYECLCEGNLKPSKKEVRSIAYFSKGQIKKLYKQKRLEYSWLIIFKKLKII